MARKLGSYLGKQGATLVSGLNHGIESAAMKGYLNAGVTHPICILSRSIDDIPDSEEMLLEIAGRDGMIIMPAHRHAPPEQVKMVRRLPVFLSGKVVIVEIHPGDPFCLEIIGGTYSETTLFALDWPYRGDATGGNHRLIEEYAAIPLHLENWTETVMDACAGKIPTVRRTGQQRFNF